MNRYCVVIPHYNHYAPLGALLDEIGKLALPVIVIDDGSDSPNRRAVEKLAADRTGVELLRLPSNRGKGAAVMRGVQLAGEHGFTHAVQIDADWQHCVADMPKLIAASRAYPDNIVAGMPLFGNDIPRSRLYGRKITLFLARVETVSCEIRDAMCGYRVYPIASFLELCDATRVRYPQDGISHFRLFRDNVDIALMHLRLLVGMLFRFPRLLHRSGDGVPDAAESGH